MLSFLYRLARSYQQEHGYRPNAVVMSKAHFRLLQESLPEIADYTDLARLLGMEVVLSEDCIHPHVAWMPMARRAAAGE
jgi:hypothetical protein